MTSELSPSPRWTSPEIIRLLSSDPSWLKDVSPKALEALIARGRVVTYRPGEHVVSHLERLENAILVLEGVLRVSSISLDGREHLVTLMEPGAIMGLLACIDGDVSPHGAIADGEMTAFLITAQEFRDFMEVCAEFRHAVLNNLCGRLRLAFSVLDQFAIGSPRARLAQRLLALGTSYGRPNDDGVEIDLHLTQDSLAAMIGLSRQRTNLILKNFEAEGLIHLNYGKVVLRGIKALEQLVEDLG